MIKYWIIEHRLCHPCCWLAPVLALASLQGCDNSTEPSDEIPSGGTGGTEQDSSDQTERLCDEGATRVTSCGIDGNGTQAQVCTKDQWVDDGPCVDTDECVNGEVEVTTTAVGDVRLACERACIQGQWTKESCHRSLAGGDDHSCALGANGDLLCWGIVGREDDAFERSAVPTPIEGISNAVAVDARQWSTCAVQADGVVVCWGLPFYNTPIDPAPVPDLVDAIAVAAGDKHYCALRQGGSVSCWGYGILGVEDGYWGATDTPLPVQDLDDAVAVVAGLGHSCALRSEGTVSCWGLGLGGTLGKEELDKAYTPIPVPGLADVVALSAASSYNCALRRDGTVACWGTTVVPRCPGDSPKHAPGEVVSVAGASHVVSIASGDQHTCALRESGDVLCWGFNLEGQVGGGELAYHSEPVAVTGLSDVVALGAGRNHSCAIRSNGEVLCWGSGVNGQLGTGRSGIESIPVPVPGLSNVLDISLGGHSCAVHETGTVSCWGESWAPEAPEMGCSPKPAPKSASPVAVPGLTNVTSVSVGSSFVCVRSLGGGIDCWGRFSSEPVGVPGIDDAIAVSAGPDAACALRPNGEVLCWEYGLMPPYESSVPAPVPDLTDAVEVSTGSFSCAVRETGYVVCWGSNIAGLGDGTTTESDVPVTVTGVHDALAVSASDRHACAMRQSGEVVCWGSNVEGQLGDGSFEDALTPVPVAGIQDAVEVHTGSQHSCVLRSSGDVACWGSGFEGRLGHGSFDTFPTPVSVVGLTDAVLVRVGGGTSCAQRQSGEVVCWGRGASGELGHGGAFSYVPVSVAWPQP